MSLIRVVAYFSEQSKGDEVEYRSSVPQSPVSHLLSSTAIPSENEEVATRDYTQKLKDQRLAVQEEINGLCGRLTEKISEERSLSAAIGESEAVLRPLRSLAPEILSEIFLQCQFSGASDESPYIPNSFHPLEGPLLLSQVCKRWRMVAITTPQLWTTLKVQFNDGQTEELKEIQLDLLSTFISRSGTLPLTMGIYVQSYISSATFKDPVITALLSHSARCREFYWITNFPEQMNFILPLLEEYTALFPILEEYSFVTCQDIGRDYIRTNEYGPMTFRPDLRFLETLPQFKRLRLRSLFDFRRLDLPLQRMTSIELYDYGELESAPSVTMEGCLQIISSCPVLKRFHTRCIGDSWTLRKELISISLTPVEHGCLTSFRLIALTNGTVSRLLKALTLPNVQDLGLFSLGSYPSWDNDSLHVFITRIGISLRILNLCGISEYKDEIHGILQRCPNVSRLTLVADFLADGFLEQFTGRTGLIVDISGRNRKPYLSRLVSIELDAKISFTPKGFSSFIKSMFNRKDSLSITSLRSLIIRCRGVTPQFINSEVFEELRRYQEQGRVIQIDTEYAPLFPRPSLLIRRFPERSR